MAFSFPTEAFGVLADALKKGTIFSKKSYLAFVTVLQWFGETFGDTVFGSPSSSGTLSVSVLLTDDEAIAKLEQLAGSGPQAILGSDAIVKAIVAFLLQKFLERMAK